MSSQKYREFYDNKRKRKIAPTHKRKTVLSQNKDESFSESEEDIRYEEEDMDLSDTNDITLVEGKHVFVKYEDKYYPW